MSQTMRRSKIRTLNIIAEHLKRQPGQHTPHTFKPTHGFSLVELLVVVAILAILAAIAIPLFLNQRSKAAQGAVQSDARNLATNLNTLFTNLPRSADPNVGLNGSTAADATLSGSGTIEVDGETLNMNLSPDVTITKTGNADPTLGAGLKITHAGVEGWACVIPLPPTVAYSYAVTFQPACGTIVSDAGNILSLNQAVFSNGDTAGWKPGASAGSSWLPKSVEYQNNDFYFGLGSMKVVTNTSYQMVTAIPVGGGWQDSVPLTSGKKYQFEFMVKGTAENVAIRAYILNSSGGSVATVGGGTLTASPNEWRKVVFEYTAPDQAAFAVWGFYRPSGAENSEFYVDAAGVWEGESGTWMPPGVPIVKP